MRSATDRAIDSLLQGNLVLIGLSGARGAKTVALVEAALLRVPLDHPAVILAESAAELFRFSGVPVLEHVRDAVALAPAPRAPDLKICVVGQARAQYEEQFRFAMPSAEMTPEERETAELGVAAWRQRWRTIDPNVGSSSIREKFVRSLGELRRRSPRAADRFNSLVQLLSKSEHDASVSAEERGRTAIRTAEQAVSLGSSRAMVVVGGIGEEAIISQAVARKRPAGTILVALSRHLGRLRVSADSVVVCGYYGPATLDGVLRVAPKSVTWIVDPVEAYHAAWELHRQAVFLHGAGLEGMASAIGLFDSALRDAVSGTLAETSEHHQSLFSWDSDGTAAIYRDAGEYTPKRTEEVDVDADFLVVLLDGTSLRVNGGRRFDVLRSQSPHPKSVRASDLQEGDEILIVRGSYQRTLSELLIEDMDKTELQNEAKIRRTWVTIAQSAMSTSGLTIDAVVRNLRAKGIDVSKQRVQSWLRDDDETTPLDWTRFLYFAREVGIALPEDQLRYFYDAIKRWRVGHRSRGREVVRALRLVYFGALSAADMARIEARWGLGVRDLIEGSRVEEVEALVPLR